MQLYPGDIHIKNDRGTVSVWIGEKAVTINCEITDKTYLRRVARNRYNKTLQDSFLNDFKTGKRQLLPDTGAKWRYGRINGQYYYCLDNIPPKHREKLPTREEIIRQNDENAAHSAANVREQFTRHLKSTFTDYVDQEDIHYYMYKSGYNISLSNASDLASARGWFEMIAYYEDSGKYNEHGIRFEQDFYELAVNALPSVMGNNLNTSGSLRKKIHYYRNAEDKRLFMISGKLGNDNRRIVGIYPLVNPETGEIFNFDIHETLIYELWMNPGRANKRLKVDVYEKYEEEIEKYGFSPVKPRTVSHYLNRFSTRAKASLERDGKEHFNDNYQPYIMQQGLQMSLTMWAADFSGSKLYYRTKKQKWVNGKKQQASVYKAESWYLFRVFDAVDGYVKGWSVCKSGEDWEQVREGLRQAVVNSGGKAACELVTDNGPAFTSKANAEKLALLFKKHRKIDPGNKQANPAEMFIRLQSQKARQFDNWMRSSFNAWHEDNIANPDYIKLNDLPDKNQALEQISQLITEWNTTVRPNGVVPEQFHSDTANHNPQAKKIDSRVSRYVFGNETRTRLGRSRGNLIISKVRDGIPVDYKFQIPNWSTTIDLIDDALGGSSEMEVVVRWEVDGADIYTPEGRYIVTAMPAKLSHKSEFEANEESFDALREQTHTKKSFAKAAREFSEEIERAKESLEQEIDPDELTYTQRGRLNGGKAKEEHNAIMRAVYEVNRNQKAHPDEDEPLDDDVLNDF